MRRNYFVNLNEKYYSLFQRLVLTDKRELWPFSSQEGFPNEGVLRDTSSPVPKSLLRHRILAHGDEGIPFFFDKDYRVFVVGSE